MFRSYLLFYLLSNVYCIYCLLDCIISSLPLQLLVFIANAVSIHIAALLCYAILYNTLLLFSLHIYLLDGSFQTLSYDDSTTVRDIVSRLCPLMQLAAMEVLQDLEDPKQYKLLHLNTNIGKRHQQQRRQQLPFLATIRDDANYLPPPPIIPACDYSFLATLFHRWSLQKLKYAKVCLPLYSYDINAQVGMICVSMCVCECVFVAVVLLPLLFTVLLTISNFNVY
jgi:hypothetical protein